MGVGISLFFIAVGAILAWGVVDTAAGIDVAAIGVILMVVGFIGLALTLTFWSSFSPFGGASPTRRVYSSGPQVDDEVVVERAPRRTRTVVVREEPPVREQTGRRVVIEDPDDR